VDLAIFSGKLNSICEEMGFVLQRSAVSPNIKDRLDFSCALFDGEGSMLAQAAHIPVHLGSMAYAMRGLVEKFDWHAGDVLVLNDPFQGGTHLPDVTLISPFLIGSDIAGFVANRAHHANIGSETPGSMPLSSRLEEEGVVISPCKLYEAGVLNQEVANILMQIEGTDSDDIPDDFHAQVSACRVGVRRIEHWFATSDGWGLERFKQASGALNTYGSEIMLGFISELKSTSASFSDYLDGDGFETEDIRICIKLKKNNDKLIFDFSGSSGEVKGNLNCPESVTAAGVYYVIACLLPPYTPRCQGVFDHIELQVPVQSVLNASPGAAVAAGNVETSMRIVDVVQGAFTNIGLETAAAAQGTMNNVAMGGRVRGAEAWDYYETLAGGTGAHARSDGLSAVQSHMTNTLNTPVESLELHYPLRIEKYEIRSGSGGEGVRRGGDGLIRAYRFLSSAQVTLLTERRTYRPWGLNADPGSPGANLLNQKKLHGKCSFNVEPGDLLEIRTPGGGAWSGIE
jgi:N-methylhydantoinase B